MKILFIHPNMPGQYKHLASAFAKDPANQLVFLTKREKGQIAGVQKITYRLRRDFSPQTHRYLMQTERAVLQGQEVWRCLKQLKNEQGFTPDIILAHPGWGDGLYVKDIYPDVPLLSFFEFYYRSQGADVGFDEHEQVTPDDLARVRSKNMHHLLGLTDSDWGISPTRWQRELQPKEFLPKITQLHDGIDTQTCQPNPDATFTVKGGPRFKVGDELVTYIARNFEPYRGFPTFMQAAERILKQRPKAHIIAVGADDISYGRRPEDGRTHRQHWLSKLDIDRSRLHFVGQIPYSDLVAMLQVSAAHMYLTYPFVLSWSAMEAMACGCALVASDTPPVREIIRDGKNGYLVDFFDAHSFADKVCEVLGSPDQNAAMRTQARADMLAHYDLQTLLPLHMQLISELASGQTSPPSHTSIMARYD